MITKEKLLSDLLKMIFDSAKSGSVEESKRLIGLAQALVDHFESPAEVAPEVVEEPKVEREEFFPVRKTTKGLRRKKPILKGAVNTSVSENRLSSMLALFKEYDVSKELLAVHLEKPISVGHVTEEDMGVLRGIYEDLREGVPLEEVFSPFN